MSSLNKKEKQPQIFTAEGAPAVHINPEQQLRRLVLSTLLWERGFYVDGVGIAESIAEVVPRVDPQRVSQLAMEARSNYKLRHVPLLLVVEMAKHASHRPFVEETLYHVIQRPDE